MNLHDAYGKLQSTKRTQPFIAVQIPEHVGLYIGVDSEDRAIIFIRAQEGQKVPSIMTEKLQIDFCAEYQLFVNGKQDVTGVFHSIRCLSSDPEDTRVFVDIIDSLISDPNTKFNVQSLSYMFYALVGLFETTPQPDVKRERQGLWAELFFMKNFGGYKKWIQAWHSEPGRLFDFSSDNKRIEIKSSVRTERIHDFSHRQLFSSGPEDIIVVSVLLTLDDTGISLRQLINEAKTALKGSMHYIRLERAIIGAAMDDPGQDGPRFNEAEALRSFAWYKAENIPRFRTPEPQGVSATHYRSDLTNTPKIPEDDVRKLITEWSA